MSLESFIRAMPKVELHVHLEGSIRPGTLLKLARHNRVDLPADSVEDLARWYVFTDFPHFLEVYYAASKCICSPDDIELIAREFLTGQARQNILHSEVTYTAFTHYVNYGIPFDEQLAALNRARHWGENELGITMTFTIDYPRELDPEGCVRSAEWAISGWKKGVSGFGLGGPEVGNPPEKFRAAFEVAHSVGLPCVPHAGETEGPASILGALDALHAVRIGHGVRCLEDSDLVARLRREQIPLEVCPTSNICLRVFESMQHHTLPRLLEAGLLVSINSDDPPMFSTTLTEEFLRITSTFSLTATQLEDLVMNAARASFLPELEKASLIARMQESFLELKAEHL